jgi:capsular polysaccharide biosynthesis protein
LDEEKYMTINPVYIDDEIDLRKWLDILLTRKWWILGLTLLVVAISFGVGSLLPKTYEATAIAAVTQLRNQLRFDTRIETVGNISINYQSFAALALSDAVIKELFDTLEVLPNGIKMPAQLRGHLKAEARADLIHLTASASDPFTAEVIANRWVEIYVPHVNHVYKSLADEQLPFFIDQLAGAEQELQQTQQALMEFQARNPELILTNQLLALETTLANTLNNRKAIDFLLDDIRSLIDQLGAQQPNESISTAAQLSAIYLQTRAFTEGDIPLPVQVQFSTPENPPTAAEQIRELEALANAMEVQAAALEAQIQALEPQIKAVQSDLQNALNEKDNLTRKQTVSQETFLALARKVQETRISSEDVSGQVKLASIAIANNQPASPRRLLITAVAGAASFLIVVMLVLFLEWWRSPDSERSDQRVQQAQSADASTEP